MRVRFSPGTLRDYTGCCEAQEYETAPSDRRSSRCNAAHRRCPRLSGEIAPDRLFLLGGGFSRLILWSFDLDRCDLAGFRVDLDFRNVLRAWFRDVERPN